MKHLELGQIIATPGALKALEKTGELPGTFLVRHQNGDWGESKDKATNDEALMAGDRVLSVYKLKDDTTIWVITEADRSVTTLLLPNEY